MEVLLLVCLIMASVQTSSEKSTTKGSQVMVCPNGQGVSSFSTSGEKYKTYAIKCSPMGSACNESCQWSTRCTRGQHGNNSFVGGMLVQYIPATEEQNLLFLCCNNFRTLDRVCFAGLERLESDSQTFGDRVSHREALSNRSNGEVAIYVERCYHRISNDTACPSEKAMRKAAVDGSRIDPNLLRFLLLLGLIGLLPAILKSSSCCCRKTGDVCVDGCTPCGKLTCVPGPNRCA